MKRTNNFKTNPNMAIPVVREHKIATEPNMKTAILQALFETVSRKWIMIISLVCGAVFGLTVLGWYVWPVEWTGGSYADLTPADQTLLIELATNLNVYNSDDPALIQLQSRWPEIDELACFVANQQVTQEEQIKLQFLAYKINQKGCE